MSVVLPAHNEEQHLAESVESVLTQSFADFELLIVNDGSEDTTPGIARRFADRDDRVHVLSTSHGGTAEALNEGISNARAPWIALTHADDRMHPYRLERQRGFLRRTGYDVISCLPIYLNERGEEIGRGTSRFTDPADVIQARRSCEVVAIHHPGVLYRREVVLSVGGYRQSYWPAEDADLWRRALDAGYTFRVQDAYLQYYRIHSDAASVRRTAAIRLQVGRIRMNCRRRRAGRTELSTAEYRIRRRQRPLSRRLAQWRVDRGVIFYKKGVAAYAGGRLLRAAAWIGAALLLRPVEISRKLARKQPWM